MTIKNPHIIHYVKNGRYLCIRACSITKSKSTKKTNKVTCKNCLEQLGWKVKKYRNRKNV